MPVHPGFMLHGSAVFAVAWLVSKRISCDAAGVNFRRTVIAPTPIMFNVTAFIDILLVLCFFFLLTWSNRSSTETDLSVALPESSQKEAPQAPPAPMIINVRSSGDLSVNNRTVTFEELKTLVERLAKLNANQTVVIRGDRRSQYDLILRVLDTCQTAGISSVGFAASVPQPK